MAKLTETVRVSRSTLEFLYSIFLIIIIPLALVVNTVLITRSVRDDFDTELRKKADLAAQVFGSAIAPSIDSVGGQIPDAQQEQVQQAINTLLAGEPDIDSISIVVPTISGFKTIAADDQALVGQTSTDVQYPVVVDRQRAVAQLQSAASNSSERVWRVTSPIANDEGKVVGLTNISVLLTESDALINATLFRSFLVLAVTVVVVVLLLANHFKFVQYAMLFRKLKEVDQLKSDFLNVATHELKAPMAIIEGGLSNIIDGYMGDIGDKAKSALTDARSQTLRLATLVEDLLNVSRIEQGKITFEMSDVAPAAVIGHIMKLYKEKADSKGLALSYEPPETGVTIRADEGRYQEIMTNLIDNAIKYSKKGTVTVSHTQDKDMLVTSVRDTGIGLSSEERSRLFRRFYRAQNENNAGVPGTGLGLWIIKQYVEKMGGKISVDSLEGVGSEFKVSLPLAKVAANDDETDAN